MEGKKREERKNENPESDKRGEAERKKQNGTKKGKTPKNKKVDLNPLIGRS